ncbi:MAG TPA: RNA 3'-terminal phosphate cyclase [Methylomirabilota bacterium]|nr:RNA 3'-terminal phosphate cyclase [Methylomirabilota bacterium]
MLTLDASHGEGGGQVLRTALALSVALGRPVTLTRIRARRPKPGLQPQHLTVVHALAAVSRAQVTGDALDSTEVSFSPQPVAGGSYRFDVGAIKGSAGSVSLLFQALCLPLFLAKEPSRLVLIGGTHVPCSPPVHYLTAVFLPALEALGARARLTLRRWGWYPRGGGEIEALIEPCRGWAGLDWSKRPATPALSGLSAVSRLPRHIAERQRHRALERLGARGLQAEIARVEDSHALGPGTLLFLTARGPDALAGFSSLGRRGVPAETIADQAVAPLLAWLDSGAAVDDHLADQLLPFLALARSPSTLTCPTRSSHLQTVAWVVQQFLPCRVELEEDPPARVRVLPAAPG